MALDRLSQVTSSGISTTISFRAAGINVSGIVTATTFVGALTGNASSATIATYTSEWILGANGSSDYTFTGPGFTGAENDPTLYLIRGQQYKFTNTMGAHPFRIQSTVNGSTGTQYNDGITNNDVSNGTLTWDVQFDAPNLLYYQCTSHGNMGGKIYILNSEDNVSAGTTALPSISPSGDPNTGIFFPSAGTIAVSAGGTERLRVDSSGSLGIGTNPSKELHVYKPSGTTTLWLESGDTQKAIAAININNDSYAFQSTYNTGGTSARPFAWYNVSTQLMSLDTSGRLLIGITTANANGGVLQLKSGITFPATAVAATDANTLDDYEEGTWSVVDRSGAGLTLTTNASIYIKIGKLVYCHADVTFPSTASTASIALSLPFIPGGVQYAQGGTVIRNNKSLVCSTFTVPDSGGSTIFLTSGLYTTYKTNVDMSSGTCQFSMTYQTD